MGTLDQPPPTNPQEPRQRSGCVTAIMLTLGIILLLPGLMCAVLIVAAGDSGRDPFTPVVMFIALGGVALIVWALSRK
ncbi:hypothetical protein [Bradyrhizobium jicamae]|uniref:hypothetical protein n=1 Tax=Bradyrhizobium jicamae TaxID=280332 RepID=UPI001BAA143D|nr:hypothetical protein [Bradyrhizobium jicamae]MBR0934986.1 hypothetical protein [Bradyrhizobium jicamae]